MSECNLALLLVCGLFFGATTVAHAAEPWPVRGKLIGKDGKKAEDVSGIACVESGGFPRSCLVIDDEVQHAQFVIVKDGAIDVGETIGLTDNPGGWELDGEGVAVANKTFVVVGSHGHPRKATENTQARIAASSQIICVRKGETPIVTGQLSEVMEANAKLKPRMGKPLDKESNGITIEGAAILETDSGHNLVIGFRGPLFEDGKAGLLKTKIDTEACSLSGDSDLQEIDLMNGRGVRDLAAFGQGLLILAGPIFDEEGPYDVFWWEDGAEVEQLGAIEPPTPGWKPEAVLPLDKVDTKNLRVLVLFDGPKEGKPFDYIINTPPM